MPLVGIGATRFGLAGAAWSFVATEYLGRAFLAWRLPRALSAPGRPLRLLDLAPLRTLARAGGAALGLAAAGAAVLEAAQRTGGGGGALLARAVPLALASAAFGAGWMAFLAASRAGGLAPVLARLVRRPISTRTPTPTSTSTST